MIRWGNERDLNCWCSSTSSASSLQIAPAWRRACSVGSLQTVVNRARESWFPERLADRIARVRALGIRYLSVALEDELSELADSASLSRNSPMFQYLGWDGHGRRTLKMAATAGGVTKEHVRLLLKRSETAALAGKCMDAGPRQGIGSLSAIVSAAGSGDRRSLAAKCRHASQVPPLWPRHRCASRWTGTFVRNQAHTRRPMARHHAENAAAAPAQVDQVGGKTAEKTGERMHDDDSFGRDSSAPRCPAAHRLVRSVHSMALRDLRTSHRASGTAIIS